MKTASERRADDFLLGYERRVKSHGNGGRIRIPRKAGIKNLVAAAQKKPEVMIKIPRRKGMSNNVAGVARHLDYISRNGELVLEDKHGNRHQGKEVKDIAKQWQLAGLLHDNSNKKEALNLVLSMPPGIDPHKVEAGAKSFAQDVFQEHEYVSVLHTDEDHPHVHIAVTMQGESGRRLNPRKQDLYQWRVMFAEKMREQGVDCAATKRVHRGQYTKAERSEIRHIKNRRGQSWVDYQQLHELKDAIKANKRPIHPFLKEQLASRNLVAKEYRALSKMLYQDGMKTEAKALSQLAIQMSSSYPKTQAQRIYDRDTKKEVNIER
ncbi:MAG: relaxase/mobilization nuclease domain-containing protein [Oceanisphaera sp.]